jgi:hypothetical protein
LGKMPTTSERRPISLFAPTIAAICRRLAFPPLIGGF